MAAHSGKSRESRPLDAVEWLTVEVQKHGFSDICSSMTLRSSCKLPTQILRQALIMLAQRQPLLRARVVTKDDKKWFECLDQDSADISLTCIDKGQQDLLAVTEELLSTVKYKVDEPAWKAFRLREEYDARSKTYVNALVLHFSHCIMDGRSNMVLLRELLTNLNAIITKGESSKPEKVESFPLLPSNTALLKNQVSWATWQRLLLFPQLYALFIRATLTMMSLKSHVNPVLCKFPVISRQSNEEVTPGTKILLRVISSDDLARLLEKCKSKGCTITGALAAACHIAFCELLSDKEGIESASNEMTIAVNARSFHSPQIPSNYIANCVATLNYNIPVSKTREEFLELAKYLSTMIQGDVKQGKHIAFISSLEAAGDAILAHIIRESALELSERRSSGHSVSNVGSFDFDTTPDDVFQVENVWFAAASHQMFPTFSNYISTVNGNLSWLVCFDRSTIAQHTVQKYHDSAWKILNTGFGLD